MHRYTIATSALFALALHIFTASSFPLQTTSPQSDTALHPIKLTDYGSSVELQRRSSNDLSNINPQNHTHLIYGSIKDNSQLVLANLTLHAQDGLPIVSLEHFEELTDDVDCLGDEGRLDLRFGTTEAFNYAKTEWDYVNKAEDRQFVFIANNDGCGPDDQRQAYIVSSVMNDAASRTTSLAAKAVAWSEVASSFDLAFGHTSVVKQANHFERGLGDDLTTFGQNVKNIGQNVVDTASGNFNQTQSKTFNLNAGTPNERSNIFNDTDAGLVLDCTNCYITGKIELTGYLLVREFKLQNFLLTMVPNSVQAALQLEATVSASGEVSSHSFTKELYHIPLPDAGISIKDVIDLGATLHYSVGVDCSFSGSAVVDFGVNTSVPDTAVIVIGYENETSEATGFDTTLLTPTFDIDNAAASATLDVWSQPEIQFGIDLHNVGRLDMDVSLKLPELTATLTADYDKDGACNHSAEALTTGVKIDSQASIDVSLGVNADLGSHDASWSHDLPSFSKPLPSLCYPVSVLGLGLLPSVTSGTALPVMPSVSANATRISASPIPSTRLGRRWGFNSSSLSHVLASVPQGSSPSRAEGVVLDVLSHLGMTRIPTLPTSSVSSSTMSSSVVPSVTSADHKTVSTPTIVTSLVISSTKSSSKTPSTAPTQSGATSILTHDTSITASNIETSTSKSAVTSSKNNGSTSSPSYSSKNSEKTTSPEISITSSTESLSVSASTISMISETTASPTPAALSTSSKALVLSSLSSYTSKTYGKSSSTVVTSFPVSSTKSSSSTNLSTTSENLKIKTPTTSTYSKSTESSVISPQTMEISRTTNTPSSSPRSQSLSTSFLPIWSTSKTISTKASKTTSISTLRSTTMSSGGHSLSHSTGTDVKTVQSERSMSSPTVASTTSSSSVHKTSSTQIDSTIISNAMTKSSTTLSLPRSTSSIKVSSHTTSLSSTATSSTATSSPATSYITTSSTTPSSTATSSTTTSSTTTSSPQPVPTTKTIPTPQKPTPTPVAQPPQTKLDQVPVSKSTPKSGGSSSESKGKSVCVPNKWHKC